MREQMPRLTSKDRMRQFARVTGIFDAGLRWTRRFGRVTSTTIAGGPNTGAAVVAVAMMLAAGCEAGGGPTAPVVEGDSTAAPTVYNPDWTEATHGKVAPNYVTVFPQDSVNRIEITMTAAQWAGVRTNMTALWGFDFGGRRNAGSPFPADDPDYVAVSVRFGGKLWKKAGWRLKGSSSLATAWGDGNYKLPFRLKFDEFEDTYPAIAGQRFFGFQDLSFSSGRSDNSLIREKVTADLLRAGGIPAARTAFYRVYVDFGTGLRYAGLYTAVEVIDDTMIKDQFGEDKGNIYKPVSRLDTFVTAEFEKKNNKGAADYSDVQALITMLGSPLRTANPAQWRAGLEAVFDVRHFVRWLSANTAMVNWDSYGTMAQNYYLYGHSARGLVWIPWDHNEALTGSPGITGVPPAPGTPGGTQRGLSLSMNEVGADWPLIRHVLDDPVYGGEYRLQLRQFATGAFAATATTALFDKYHALVAPYVIGPSGEQPGATYLPSPTAFTFALADLKSHAAARRALIASFVP